MQFPFVDLPYGPIAILSDVHDRLPLLRKALAILMARKVDTILFAGDFCSPIVAGEMLQFHGVIHAVFGNGDGDRWKIQQIADSQPGKLAIHGEFVQFEMADAGQETVRLALTHYQFYAQALARTGDYNAVFYGHTHVRQVDQFGQSLCVNPGEVMDWKDRPSFAIYDPATHLVEFVELA